ncbi:hypothetical protein [Alloacidobacterium sp.]|uniref:hypothetical protein n=1 Tax=Alloacidobacterium sp. TaxID=2951999 RepID=UPI002D6050C5|nr:hypothetical protein [Alloacidobacterium sp.]HYK36755.1 hypothetical protein [Alloacidobacterium sp.]
MKPNLFYAALAALLLLALCPSLATAQQGQQQQEQQQPGDQASPPAQPQSATPDAKASDTANPKPEANKATSPEEARQAQIVADSQKLYQLAQELKAEVAKSNKNTLSIAVTKKAEEIEKLAKSMKERMRKE